ncbi:hypothetical protein C8A01DRAFT_37638 [Parachaetomium inaequale]|uniref:Cytochrome b561 domain-containing protein n=1 Tax=Parachaetomium inaequale TaxID=2588326 RepID=A0AAN6PH22_9PEZI|nr:hypothetical protein C8A01DRAFT_37638 [Parachaetomium inaequale]
MGSQRPSYRLALLIAAAFLVLTVSARGPGGGGGGYYGPPGGGGGEATGSGTSTSGGDTSSSSDSNSGSYYGFDNANGFGGGSRGGNGGNGRAGAGRPGFDIEQALSFRRIHGILAALAMVLLFPIGSILLRVLPGRVGVWVHAVFQVLAWCVYVAGAAVGIYLVTLVQIPGGGLLQNPTTRYHPIIGLVLLALFVVQPVIGFVHHRVYKKVERRQMWSWAHLAIGRGGITLGIVNGGLGLYLSGASAYYTRVYVIVAAIMWALWMAVAIWAEIRRARKNRRPKDEPKNDPKNEPKNEPTNES